MKKFYIIQSTKKNKNGHVSHLMVVDAEGELCEISPRTGKKIHSDFCPMKPEELERWGYEIINPRKAMFTGAMFYPFFDYLVENYLCLIAE